MKRMVWKCGAEAGSVLVGVKPHNRGVLVQVYHEQEKGGGPLGGTFCLLDAGENQHAETLTPYVGTDLNAADLLAILRRQHPQCVNPVNANALALAATRTELQAGEASVPAKPPILVVDDAEVLIRRLALGLGSGCLLQNNRAVPVEAAHRADSNRSGVGIVLGTDSEVGTGSGAEGLGVGLGLGQQVIAVVMEACLQEP